MQDSAATHRVAAQLHQACRDVGFFYIQGHGTYPAGMLASLSLSSFLDGAQHIVSFGAGMPNAISNGVRQEARHWFNLPVDTSLPVY